MSYEFRLKSRSKDVRQSFGRNKKLAHGGKSDQEVISFLEDLLMHFAKGHADTDEAFAYLVRCMGHAARRNSPLAYEPFGYQTIFVSDESTVQRQQAAEPKWTWPVVHRSSSKSSSFGDILKDFSALKMFDYTVGKTNGWPDSKRKKFLDDFMRLDLPHAVESEFGDEYGSPMTTERLRKVAVLLASLASFAYRKKAHSMRHAIRDWEHDLQFLKETFYEDEGLMFRPWPSSKPN